MTWEKEMASSKVSPSNPRAKSFTMGRFRSQNRHMMAREMRITMVMTVSVNLRSRLGFCCWMRE